MRLMDLIKKELVQIDLRSRDKWEAIETLVAVLVREGRIRPEDQETVLDALVTRERSMSTGMEHGVAIPHGSVSCVDDIVATFATSKEGIPFDSIDGQPARLIILLVIPKDRFKKHIQTLAGIARLLNQEDLRRELIEAGTAEDAIEIIKRKEEADYLTD